MDLNEHELAELEERLYSRIHHAAEVSETQNDNNLLSSFNPTPVTSKPSTPGSPTSSTNPVRLVTDKSVINNPRQTAVTASTKIKRYWDSLQQQNSRMSYPGINKPKKIGTADVRSVEEGRVVQTKKVFTPYQSILGSLGGSPTIETNITEQQQRQDPKQKKRKHSQNGGKQIHNPSGNRNRKMDQLKKIKRKKSKALKSRQRLEIGEQRLVATIDLDTSSEEEGEYISPDPVKQEKKAKADQWEDLHEDSDPDEVVLIPSAPPPLVCIEDSDEDGTKDGFTQPKSKKKKKPIKKINSPRCVSPSNSSIMSDDFIGQSDRTRINDSFIDGINNDEELDCTAPHTVGSLLAGERRSFGDRGGRAPSISSDCTVATSSDTTDPDKRNGLKPVHAIAGHAMGAPNLSSTPKQTLTAKKLSVVSKQSKCIEDDSIYAATSSKKSKPSAEKHLSSDSSNESDGGNVSSHSKRSKSYQSDTSTSNKSILKRRKKRQKQDSEHYSDEDFASMLTDIVQAISENEEESSDEEVQPLLEIVENPLNKEQPSVGQQDKQDASNDLSDEVQMIEEQDPQDEISLPQIEDMALEASVSNTEPAESNNSLMDAVSMAPPPLPIINLTEEESLNQSQSEPTQEQPGDDMSEGARLDHADPECGWNDEMRRFYNDSWNCEDFNISTVLFNMPRANKFWPIVHKDKYPDPPKKEIICNNCGERGHMRYKCRNPPKPKTCYMCGLAGHQEVRCPNTLCLKCGEKTRNFLRGCQSCTREQNMTCHLCGVRGHGQRNCPDKWRRYHSTIEDNKPLTQQYDRNPNAKHCCICSRTGHQAHTCNAALRIFGQLVPTTEVKSYQPVYHINERIGQQNENHGVKFNLFSDMFDYQLNFDESFAANEKSFYYRFAKSVGIVEEKKRKAEKLTRKLKREARKRKRSEGIQSTNSTTNDTVIIDDDSSTFDAQGKPDQPQSNTDGNQTKPTNEDSNYSFSEFFEDKTANLPQPSEPMPDFIPLVSTETTSTSVVPVQQPTDAKIYLTKPHAKILLGPAGAAFLKDASSKFSLKVSILFQTVGNVLLANGLSADQDNFHNELVKFLNNASHQNEQLKLINNVPKATEKIIRYITEHLLLLTRSYENAKVLFKRYQHFEEQGANVKTCDKIRRTLNIILFGQYGMRAGRDHLTKLQNNLKDLQNTKDANMSSDVRDEINQHIRYIFTSYDHADYESILNEFDRLRKYKKLYKITAEELNLPKLPAQKVSPESAQKPADDSFNLSKDLNFEEDEDLILNTSDQLIDSSRSSLNFDDQSDEDSNQSTENPHLNTTSTTQKKHISPREHRIGKLVEESRHMVTMLNNAPITDKFERISSQTRRGKLSKADFRMLLRIHALLRHKLSRKVSFRNNGLPSV